MAKNCLKIKEILFIYINKVSLLFKNISLYSLAALNLTSHWAMELWLIYLSKYSLTLCWGLLQCQLGIVEFVAVLLFMTAEVRTSTKLTLTRNKDFAITGINLVGWESSMEFVPKPSCWDRKRFPRQLGLYLNKTTCESVCSFVG